MNMNKQLEEAVKKEAQKYAMIVGREYTGEYDGSHLQDAYEVGYAKCYASLTGDQAGRWQTWDQIPETFAEFHLRYSYDKVKLDADLFELRGNAIYKKGGGTIPLVAKDIEYLSESPSEPLRELQKRIEVLERENAELKKAVIDRSRCY